MPALITTDLVALDADIGADKGAVVRRLAELVAGAGRATDADALHADVLAREASTGILWLYPGDGRGGWLARVSADAGWNGLDPLF